VRDDHTRRIGLGKLFASTVLWANLGAIPSRRNTSGFFSHGHDAAAKLLKDAGYEVSVATVDASSRSSVHALVEKAVALGNVTGLIHAAGLSPARRPR
jgi:NAD(P)-dependent dehydrogenase (short-subunit alcohol dehydrogenase family)